MKEFYAVVQIETVDLLPRGVRFPSDRVGMVAAQPFVPSAALSAAEPYRYVPAAQAQQLAMVEETLAVARAAHHGVCKTHFTLFPEYSIPGVAGVAAVDAAVVAANWPRGTIVIGGTDALSRPEYVQLLAAPGTHVDAGRNGPDRVAQDEWVNCAITWVKGEDGRVERWLQPKLHPAFDEMDIAHQHMFCGGSIYLFKGRLANDAPYRFATLICFDWIATLGDRTPCGWILADLHQHASGNQLPLSWLFVIQRNKKPSHETFLTRVGDFFNQTQFPNALRERACLVFANTAGKAVPGRASEFGGFSVVLSPQSLFTSPTCAPTFCKGGMRFRDGSNLLHSYKDVFFRERGACIHSLAQINPGSLIAGAAGRKFPVDRADVYPISGTPEPRAPRAPVPAAVKWLNDELDEIQSLSARYPAAELCAQVDNSHQQSIAALRRMSSQSTKTAVKLAAQESIVTNEDEWLRPSPMR